MASPDPQLRPVASGVVKRLTLRLPELGYERLRALVERHQVSAQAIYRAGTCVHLEAQHDSDAAIRQATIDTWAVAREIVAGADWAGQPRRRRVSVDMPAELFEAIADACRRHRVSQNGAFALVVMPWPADIPDHVRRVRRVLLERIVELARDPANQWLVPDVPAIDPIVVY